MAYKKRKRDAAAKKRRRLLIVVGLVLSFLLLAISTAFAGFVLVATSTENLPNLKGKQLFSRAQTTKVYDANNVLITDLYVEQNRVNVPLEKISPYLQNAVIAIEDRRFYKHEGIDLKAIGRAIIRDMRTGQLVEGGSTLTQQFVKNTTTNSEKTFQRKIREAALAYQIERKFSKKEILKGYLNTIYFGQSTYGVETASQNLFSKHADELSLAEAALLAGVIRSPNNYSPYTNPDTAKARRDLVLRLMLKEKMISKEEADAALAAPVQVSPPKNPGYPYPYFVEYVKQLIMEDPQFGSTVSERANRLFRGGLRIYTTIDPKLQQFADQAVWSTLDRPDDPVGSLVSIDSKSGHIRAMVGGPDWQKQKFNLAVQAQRQPGSSFKPFVLAAAIEGGISISKTYESRPAVIRLPGKNWVVNNATEGRGGGQMSLRDATVNSVNAVYARLMMDVGPEKVVELVKKMGIKSPVEPVPAIALGGLGIGVTPLDMASAYTTFANGGQHPRPTAITRITDADGKVLKENITQYDQSLEPVTAYLVTDILKDVIRGGTGRRANIGRPAAGKTGTTEYNGDAWFVGYTPHLTTSVWVGYRDSRRSMHNVHGISVQGGTFPAEIWQKFMSKAHAGIAAKDFDRPTKGLTGIKVCADMPGYLANEYCADVKYETYARGTGPKLICDRHKPPPNVKVPNVVGMMLVEAKQALSEAALAFELKDVDSAAVPAGQVLAQTPTEGSELPQGGIVVLQVSTGRAPINKVKVPPVVGMTEGRAKALLEDAGLMVSIVYVSVNNPDQLGKAIGLLPPARTLVPTGSTVTLRIGKP